MNRGQHYFTREPAAPSRPAVARLVLPDLTLDLTTDAGVFSRGGVDRGTELLLRSVRPRADAAELLDLGCGFGPIAMALALRSPGARVWAVDINQRALQLTQENAARTGAHNVTTAVPDAVPADIRFDGIFSNPPVRIGKAALQELLAAWLDRLRPGAAAHLVVHRHLGADSLAAWLSEHGYPAERLRSRGGYRVLEVHAAA